jgi:Mor family transcriptional regulator
MDDKIIIKEYKEGLSSLKLAKKYGCSKSKILNILKKNKIERRNLKKDISKKQENLIVELYSNKVKIEEIILATNLCERKIYEVLKKYNLVRNLNKKIDNETKSKIYNDYVNQTPIKEIQLKYNIKGNGTVYKILYEKGVKIERKAHNKIPDDIKNKIVEEYISGLNICELHEKYHYGTTTIARWVKNANVTRNFSDAFTLSANKGRKHFKGTNLPWYSTKSDKWYVADSLWEAVRMQQLDNDTSVINWEKNTERILYTDDNNEKHYYIPDFKIFYDNKIVVEEIKPSNLVNDKINQIKFEVAKQFYKEKNIKYKIVTENEIGIENIKNFNPDGLIKYTQEICKEHKRKLRNEREKRKRKNAKVNNNRITV